MLTGTSELRRGSMKVALHRTCCLARAAPRNSLQWVGPDGAAGTVYNGKDGQERASLSLSSPDFISQLRLKGPKGAGAVTVGGTPDGLPSLSMFDHHGTGRLGLGLGQPAISLTIFDSHGHYRVGVGITGEDRPRVDLFDERE